MEYINDEAQGGALLVASRSPRPAPERYYLMIDPVPSERVMRWFLDIKSFWFDESLGPNTFTGMRADAERYLMQWVKTGQFPVPQTGLEIHCEMKMEEWLRDCWREQAQDGVTASAPSTTAE